MIDLHCHILHGIDDGPKSPSESMQMALNFERAGYRMVAATPHMVPGTAWMPSTDRINTRVDRLNHAIRDERLKLEIVSGMEIALDPQIPDLLDQDHLLDPRGLLLPADRTVVPATSSGWEQVIFSILAKGYSILLAHPERCVQLAANPDLIERLIKTGVFLQVNLGSFLGQYGRTAMNTARKMAGRGWIHCLATDSHQPGGHAPERIGEATATLQRLIGRENLQQSPQTIRFAC